MPVDWKSNVGLVKKERAMIFQNKCVELSEGILCVNSAIMPKPGIKNYSKVPVINGTNHNTTLMKNPVIGDLEYATSIVLLEVRKNTSDHTRIRKTTINKAEVVKANKPTADSKEDSASGKDDHYQKDRR